VTILFIPKSAFSGFSVDDLAQAKAFYGQTLGLEVKEEGAGLTLQLPGGGAVFIYSKPNHQPATLPGSKTRPAISCRSSKTPASLPAARL
jgi:catechol 2,3-dioxygenase-like lactoylglutathione lyase family enzyme